MTRSRFLELARSLIPELPAPPKLLPVPAQRVARDGAVVAELPAQRTASLAVIAREPAVGAGERAADESRWFDWRRARGAAPQPPPEPPGTPSDDAVTAEAGGSAATAEGPPASRWFRSAGS